MGDLTKFTVKDDAVSPGGYINSVLLAANVAETFTVPSDPFTGKKANYVSFKRTGDFYAKAFETALADLVTNGTFAADASWTKGTGWTIGAGVATATGAISTALSQSLNVKEGHSYLVTFTATRSAGSITPSLGGTAGTARSSSATFSEVILAGADGTLSFGTSGFTGTVDNVSVIEVAVVPGDVTLGTSAELNPDKVYLGGAYSSISVVSAGTPIITASFYL